MFACLIWMLVIICIAVFGGAIIGLIIGVGKLIGGPK